MFILFYLRKGSESYGESEIVLVDFFYSFKLQLRESIWFVPHSYLEGLDGGTNVRVCCKNAPVGNTIHYISAAKHFSVSFI